MAHSAPQSSPRVSLPGLIASFGTSIYSFLIRMADAQTRVQQIKFLQSLSDEDLRKLRLTRDRIPHRVFADSIWL
ncbi:hypothetical protein RUESEDTHA_02796 [Ruegeria sp. THAF57]|uniref:hypothetical protein n=1 Tax=Ruegeria sp. THAF57 TaxID=2744555 RepID=UPI0015DEFE52|nr:hypothetical protein [Ruegeria sp. THAF57]CAD0185895.1 hypothetical protein RUESEDTHA_02796 [Ruegeria sp. THAF57]